MDALAQVMAFAITDALHPPEPAHPIAWVEHETEWVIVYEDGRKIHHAKTPAAGTSTPAASSPAVATEPPKDGHRPNARQRKRKD